MTPFREWPEGEPFEMMTGGNTRYGVKLRPLEYYHVEKDGNSGAKQPANAFFFDTLTLETVSHNKKVSAVRPVRGRLARTHDNRLIIVKELQKGVFAAYYVNLSSYQTVSNADFNLIPNESGKRRDEVDIILQILKKSHEKARKAIELLESELIE